ncbi:MAG: hypothetical protein J5I90_15800 [Caldilineales bacterium]|nr:hypothetical protein [Caldilineales bacterium]
METKLIAPADQSDRDLPIELMQEFINEFDPYELRNGTALVICHDEKSDAHYLTCHVSGADLALKCDLEATLDADDDDDLYKLNRDITEDKIAYRDMENDALGGRSFEDIVLEYDTSYRADTPLKVYGGQHRIRAIFKALEKGKIVPHGVRVYFGLSREQKVEIAIVNNTSIAVSNDLLDRMREQMTGSALRNWCQRTGMLAVGEDFADRRSGEIPTVRIARTLIVNFFRGMNASDTELHQPVLCASGGTDDTYERLRTSIDWNNDKLHQMGHQFARLHKIQRSAIIGRTSDNSAEFARKAFSLSVVAGWSYAAGLFQSNTEYLDTLYSLPESVSPPDDPLNAKALSEARLKGVDPDTYRGLGTRSSSKELGRMLEVFIVLATKATRKQINKQLANAAIQSYEAKRANYEAEKALGRI